MYKLSSQETCYKYKEAWQGAWWHDGKAFSDEKNNPTYASGKQCHEDQILLKALQTSWCNLRFEIYNIDSWESTFQMKVWLGSTIRNVTPSFS
jgi:hypothetical protein